MRTILLVGTLALGSACNSAPLETDPPADSPALEAGLQYEGSVVESGPDEPIALSAPLFPDSGVFQRFQDASQYAQLTEAEKLALADGAVRTFEELLPLCAAQDPTITLRGDGDPPLTAAQLAANYDAVARCSYQSYGAKPYWVPQHVLDVDFCARRLGAAWHLPTEAEVAAFSESDFQFFQDTLSVLPGVGQFPVHFYYTLDVYVRKSDGTLALGNLAPGTSHVEPLPVSGSDLDALYVGDGRPIGLRCLRASGS